MTIAATLISSLLTTAILNQSEVAQPAQTLRLEVVVINQDGRPLDGVEVSVRSSGLTREFSGDLQGRLVMVLPEGIYDIAFSRPDFYETIIRGVEVAIVADPELRKESLEPLRVLMQRRLIFEKDLVVIGPRYVDAPSLDLGFKLVEPLALGRPALGVVTLTNNGDMPIEIPLQREFKWTPETLVMRIFVEIAGSSAKFDEPFVCVPSKRDCRSLKPGESVEIPIRLNSRQEYGAGQSVPITWSEVGDYEGKAGVYFMHEGPDPERPTYTRQIETAFRLTIRE